MAACCPAAREVRATTGRSRWSPWCTAARTAVTRTSLCCTGTLRPVAGRRRVRGLPAEPARRAGTATSSRPGRRRGRPGRVGRHPDRDRPAGRAGVADPDRLGIGGWSHGGFFAAWAVGRTERFKAALMGAGISDWGMLAATGEFGPWRPRWAAARMGRRRPAPARPAQPGLSRREDPDAGAHPARRAGHERPARQAVYFHRALRHHGIEHEFVVYPGEGHRSANARTSWTCFSACGIGSTAGCADPPARPTSAPARAALRAATAGSGCVWSVLSRNHLFGQASGACER